MWRSNTKNRVMNVDEGPKCWVFVAISLCLCNFLLNIKCSKCQIPYIVKLKFYVSVIMLVEEG